MLVISDHSPISYLVLLDCVHVLPALFTRVMIPSAVRAELQHPNTPAVVRTWMAQPPAWLDIRQVNGTPEADVVNLDVGEQAVIRLAQTLHAVWCCWTMGRRVKPLYAARCGSWARWACWNTRHSVGLSTCPRCSRGY